MDKSAKRKWTRRGLIAGNLAILLVVGAFVMSNRSASQTVRASTLSGAVATAGSSTNPLDTLSSAQIALTAAQISHMSELTQIKNQAESDSLLLAVAPSDSTVLAKPQLVTTAQKSKQDIITYTVAGGDNVDTLAGKFGVSADSIRWSNGLSGTNLTVGNPISIPPVNGIVYVVKAGDTPSSIAAKYSADEGQVIALNDAEISGLHAGEKIIVPNGKIAPVVSYGAYYGSFVASYGGNGYAYGYCTYYAAARVAVPGNWGNANTWDNYAAVTPGWVVSRSPVAGAILQADSGFAGHVGYVEAVSDDGTMIKYSDMNGIAGWNRVGYSDWVPASNFPHYIYRQ